MDPRRVYSAGFSNGGAASVSLTRDYPQLFAAISGMGWIVDISDTTPYWGYLPTSVTTTSYENRNWQFSNYKKSGYRVPFAQFVLIDGAGHRLNKSEATVAWEFLRHLARNSDGSVVELP